MSGGHWLRWFLIATGIALLVVMGCRRPAAATRPAADGTLHVFVSIAPQKYFVERIAGPRADVSVLLPPGQSHHSYEPTPRQIVDLSNAQVFFCASIPFERQVVGKIGSAMAHLRIVNTTQGIDLRTEEACEDEGHEHHAHEQDVHTWMDPLLVKRQAEVICRTLCELDAARAADYRHNLASFHADLDRVDAEIRETLAPLKGREFFVFHPAFGYFAERYGLVQVAVEIAGKQPTSKQLIHLIERAKAGNVRLVFVQPQFPRGSAVALAQAIGGAVVSMDPMAEDYLTNLHDVAGKIRQALTAGGESSAQSQP